MHGQLCITYVKLRCAQYYQSDNTIYNAPVLICFHHNHIVILITFFSYPYTATNHYAVYIKQCQAYEMGRVYYHQLSHTSVQL